MKRNLFFLLAFVAVIAFASCQKNVITSGGQDGTELVTVSIGLPDDYATKATVGDGTTANLLYYELYDSNKNLIVNGTKELKDKQTTITFNLIRNATYDVLYWAQANSNCPYTATDLQCVLMNYPTDVSQDKSTTGNNENRDAFYYHQTFKVDGSNPDAVILTRPFAQVNFVANDLHSTMYFNGTNLSTTVTLNSSTITFYSIPTTFNVWDGTASGETTAIFYAGSYVDIDGNSYCDLLPKGNDNDYLVSMNYILPPSSTNTLHVVAKFDYQYTTTNNPVAVTGIYEFTSSSNENSVDTRYYAPLPVSKNYRTNIIGNLFTAGGDISITVSNHLGSDDKTVQTASTL